jgi:hypothetical protein
MCGLKLFLSSSAQVSPNKNMGISPTRQD